MKKKLMKRLLSGILVAALGLTQMPLGNVGAVEKVYAATNYVTNGEFSVNTETWNLSTTSGGETVENLILGSGASAGKTENGAYIENKTGNNSDTYLTTTISSLPAGTYKFSAYVMGNGFTDAYPVIDNEAVWGDDNKVTSPGWQTEVSGWKKVEYTFTIDETKENYVVGVYFWTKSGNDWTCIDDVSVIEVSEKPEEANYVTNGEFSVNTETWNLSTTSGGEAVENLMLGSGASAGKTENGAYIENKTGNDSDTYLTTTIGSLPAGTYKFSAYVMGSGFTDAYPVIDGSAVWGDDNKVTSPGWQTEVSGWKKVEYTFTIDETKANYVVGVYFWTKNGNDWTCIDDISVVAASDVAEEVTYDLSVSASKKSYITPGETVTLTANYSASDGSEVTIGEDYSAYWYVNDEMGGLENVEFVGVETNEDNVAAASGNQIQVKLPSEGEYYISTNLRKNGNEKELAWYTIKLSTKGIEDVYVEKLELDNDFIKGVDISSLEAELASGVKFYNFNGDELDEAGFFNLLKECGVNWVRLRVWNDPKNGEGRGYGGGNCDLEKAKSMGKLATDAGLRVLIDFHYSDTWADPKRQYAPKAWKDKSVDERIQLIQSYTYESVKGLIDAGVDVGMVQVGNETSNKICDIGENEGVSESSTIKPMQKMCEAFNEGAKGVRKAAQEKGKTIKVAIHIESPQAEGKYANYAKALNEFNVDYDVFASSYYPMWHGSLENLNNVLSDIATKYNKEVLVAETSWAYTIEDGDGAGNEDGGQYNQYEHSVQGQVNQLCDVTKTIANTTNGIGVFYWEPAWIPVNYVYDDAGNWQESAKQANVVAWETYGSGWATTASAGYDAEVGPNGEWAGGSGVDNHAWFDWYGYPLASLKAFKYMEEGNTTLPKSVRDVVADDVLAYVGMSFETPAVRIRYNYGEDKITKNVTWNQQEITDARNKGVGTYIIHGTVTDLGKNYDVSFELTIEKYNYLADKDYSFEDSKNAWTIEGGSESADWKILANDPKSGVKALKYNKALTDASAYQTITLNKGTYTFGGYMQGAPKVEGESYEIFVTIGDETKTASATPADWAVWQNPEITDIEITANNTPVIVGCKVTTTSGAWGTWDDFYINKTSTDDESGNGDNGSTGDNNGGSNNNSGSTPSTPPTNTKPDNTTETKPDGTKVETTTETKPDGTKVETTTETATDGSKKETVVETKTDGTKVETVTETATDGSKVETKKESETNTAGKQVEVATVTKTDADGKVTSVVEKSTISEVAENTTATVTVKKNGEGAVTSAKASVAATIEGKKTSLSADVIAQVQEASGQKDVAVTVTAKNDEGKTLYKVNVDAKDLTADNALYIYKVDSKTGELVMVNNKTYKVDENGGLDISIKNKATYELMSKEEAKAVEKQIKATIKVQNSSKDVKKGKTTKVAFDKKMNMNNVKEITYSTADKKIATISKSGKVTAKAKGTVKIKVKVTLKNGSTKTVTMTIKVK